jgi:hypothetical protein
MGTNMEGSLYHSGESILLPGFGDISDLRSDLRSAKSRDRVVIAV